MCGERGHRNARTWTSLSTTTIIRLTGSLKCDSFWPRTTWQWSPIPHTHPICPPVTFSSSTSWSFGWRVEESKPLKRFKRNRSENLTNSKKGLPEMLGQLYSCKRGVLRKWWRNLTSKLSKLLFTSTVLELLYTPLYKYRKRTIWS